MWLLCAAQSTVGSVIGEGLTHLLARTGQVSDYAAERDCHDVVNLVVAELAYCSQQKDCSFGGRQLPERCDNLILKMLHERAGVLQDDGQGVVGKVLGRWGGNVFQTLSEWCGFPFSVAVEKFESDESKYPGPEIGPFGLAIKASKRFHDRALKYSGPQKVDHSGHLHLL